MRTILVTGVAGFIGSNVAATLLARGDRVLGLDNLSQGDLRNIKACIDHPHFQMTEGDVLDGELVMRLSEGCRAILHLAAYKIPRYSNALATLRINSQGTRCVLDAGVCHGCRVVLASTSDVYGMNPNLPFSETSDLWLGPSSVRRWAYASSKLYDEHLAFAFQEEKNLPIVLIRFFGGYGPHQNTTWWGGPQAVFIDAALQNREMEIHGDGMQTRSFTYIDDHVDGILRCLDSEAALGEVFNLGATREITILDLARVIWSLVREDEPKCTFLSYQNFGKYQDVRRRVPDTTKARNLLGFQANVDLEDGLRRTIAWQRERKENRL